MSQEAGEPVVPLPGQLAFRFMADGLAAAERFRLVSEQARRERKPEESRGGRMKRGTTRSSRRLPKAG
jgi:hypothetical protein